MKRLSLAPILAVLALAGCGHSHKPAAHAIALAPASTQSAMGTVAPAGWGSTPPGFHPPRAVQATPTAAMLDGIFVSDFAGLQPFAVAGYTAGHWPDYVGLHAAFPRAHAVSIAISARWHADCLDVEPGDASPGEAGQWATSDIRAGFAHPCLYSDLSEMPSVRASLAASLGSSWRARVFLWLAWYRFVPGLVSGYDAVQWTDRCFSRNLDCSTVSLAFLSIAQPPYQPPAPPKPKPAPKPQPAPWSSAEVQIQGARPNATVTLRLARGHWTLSGAHARVHSLPYNARPLGG